MPDLSSELSSIDFASMIGGPLSAVIAAQAQAASTSVDFIQTVGFDGGDVRQVEFTYTKTVPDPSSGTGTSGTGTTSASYTLSVPFLTMVPIPFIRVEEATVDFNAKIQSVEAMSTSTSSQMNVQVESSSSINFRMFTASTAIKASFSNKRSTTATSRVERTYSMAVHVRAVQDELPPGTERLLSILEKAITEVPTPAGSAPVPAAPPP